MQNVEHDHLKQYEGFYTIGDVHTKLLEMGINKPVPTIRNWVNDLHQFQVHTLGRNSRGERIFKTSDIEIIRFIAEAKNRFGNNLSMATICQMIVENEAFKEHLFYDPNDGNTSGESNAPALPEHRIREYLKQELEEISKIKEEMLEMKNNYELQLKQLPSPEKEKEERAIEFRTMILDRNALERRVRTKLREEAIKEWDKNPIKKGFLIKSEDTAAKILFIDKFIDEHFEERLKGEDQ
ncbi:hypothetical protein [Paenibacillus sp. IITD108]|uniref:hypothetical protein n=1 Tax=Paenibacillus sp. IITD108 TaxID=3116649 RepID=UPI002F3F0D29